MSTGIPKEIPTETAGDAVDGDGKMMKRWKRYPAYKDSGVEWLGGVPVGWDVKRLKDSIELCKNGVWGDDPNGKDDIRCIRVADFNRLSFTVNIENQTYRAVLNKDLNGRTLKNGDLLIEKSGGGEKQAVGTVVCYNLDNKAVCSNFIARLLISINYYANYLVYLHATLYSICINQRSIKQTTGIQNLDIHSYFNENVAYPPLPEQHAIATFLDAQTARIDTLIAKKERQIELLKENRAALISHAVTKGLDPDAEMKDSGVEWLGEVPKHWEITKLTRLTTRIGDGLHGTPEYVDESPYYFINGNNLSDGSIKITSSTRCVSEDEFQKYSITLDESTLLISINGTIGNIANYQAESIILGKSAAYINCGRLLSRSFLYFLLQSREVENFFQYEMTGTTIYNLSLASIRNIPVPLPTFSEQNDIITYLDRETARIDTLVEKVETSIATLREYRTALISAAVTGKIDVRDEVVA